MKQMDEAMQQIDHLKQEKKLVKAELERTQRKIGVIPTGDAAISPFFVYATCILSFKKKQFMLTLWRTKRPNGSSSFE